MIIKKNKQAKYYTYEGKVRFQIRPFKFSNLNLNDTNSSIKDQFDYCLCDWEGIKNEDGTNFECNEKNKLELYDYYTGVREFVFDKVRTIQEGMDKDLKN